MVPMTRTTPIATCQNGTTPAAMRIGMITGANSGMNDRTVVPTASGVGCGHRERKDPRGDKHEDHR